MMKDTKGTALKTSKSEQAGRLKQIEEEALREIVSKVAGKSAAELVPILKDKGHVDEFKIAGKAKITINELRNILYKLHHHDLVSSIRKKDNKKGWFIYFWSLNVERAIRSLIREYSKEFESQTSLLDSRTKKNYYICPKGHTELSEESSLEQNFECIECGELLVLKDREIEQRKINKTIDTIQERVNLLRELVHKYEAANKIAFEKDIIKSCRKKSASQSRETRRSEARESESKSKGKEGGEEGAQERDEEIERFLEGFKCFFPLF